MKHFPIADFINLNNQPVRRRSLQETSNALGELRLQEKQNAHGELRLQEKPRKMLLASWGYRKNQEKCSWWAEVIGKTKKQCSWRAEVIENVILPCSLLLFPNYPHSPTHLPLPSYPPLLLPHFLLLLDSLLFLREILFNYVMRNTIKLVPS